MLTVNVADTTYLSFTWDEVEDYASELAEQIRKVYQPHTILAVIRGGAVVGVLLADRLGVGKIYTVNLRSYDKPEARGAVKIYQKPPVECISDRKVLIVDDIVDSGQSLSTVIQLIEQNRPEEVRSAALLVKEHSTYTPDFYVKKVKGWVFYPWEVREACEEIYSKTSNIKDAKKILIYDLGFSEKEVNRILEQIKASKYDD